MFFNISLKHNNIYQPLTIKFTTKSYSRAWVCSIQNAWRNVKGIIFNVSFKKDNGVLRAYTTHRVLWFFGNCRCCKLHKYWLLKYYRMLFNVRLYTTTTTNSGEVNFCTLPIWQQINGYALKQCNACKKTVSLTYVRCTSHIYMVKTTGSRFSQIFRES